MPSLAEIAGQNIRRYRRERGMTQEQLGEKSDVDFKYVGAIERGTANFTIGVLERIASTLGIDASLLLRRADDPPRLPRGRELFKLLEKLDFNDMRFVEDVVTSYVARKPKRKPGPPRQ